MEGFSDTLVQFVIRNGTPEGWLAVGDWLQVYKDRSDVSGALPLIGSMRQSTHGIGVRPSSVTSYTRQGTPSATG